MSSKFKCEEVQAYFFMFASQEAGVWRDFFFYRQQDQDVFAQQVYYTTLKPTSAATLPGGSPDTYSACCSLVSSVAKARKANPPSHPIY